MADEQLTTGRWRAPHTPSPLSSPPPLPAALSPPPHLTVSSSTMAIDSAKSVDVDDAGEWHGDWRSCAPLPPPHSPGGIDGRGGFKVGIGPHGSLRISEQMSPYGWEHRAQHPQPTWWDRLERHEARRPMGSIGAPRGPWTFESELVPAEEEGKEWLVNSGGDDSEIVPETEFQYDMSSKENDVLGVAMDDHATKVITKPAFVEVDPDAETDDEFVTIEGKKTSEKDELVIEEPTMSYADLSWEDFQLEWMLLFYPESTHPLLRRLKREEKEQHEREEQDRCIIVMFICTAI